MRLAFLIDFFLVNIICINVLCTEEQRLHLPLFSCTFLFPCLVLVHLPVLCVLYFSFVTSYYCCVCCCLQECSVNSPDYGPLPPNSPAWCLAPFDPEGILRLGNKHCVSPSTVFQASQCVHPETLQTIEYRDPIPKLGLNLLQLMW